MVGGAYAAGRLAWLEVCSTHARIIRTCAADIGITRIIFFVIFCHFLVMLPCHVLVIPFSIVVFLSCCLVMFLSFFFPLSFFCHAALSCPRQFLAACHFLVTLAPRLFVLVFSLSSCLVISLSSFSCDHSAAAAI